MKIRNHYENVHCHYDGQTRAQDVYLHLDAEEEVLEVRVYDDTYCVEDTSGQVWWPDEDTAAEIASSDDPAAAALRICEEEPLRGEWRS